MQLVLLVCLVQLWLRFVYSNGASLPAMATKSRYRENNRIRDGMTPMKALEASIISWNMAEKAPTEDSCNFIKLYRDDDIVVFGIQECENIRPRRNEGHRSRKWRSVQSKMLGRSFRCIARHKMGGLLLAVYVRKNISKEIEGLQISDVACGVGNVLTNKGAVSVVLRVRDRTVALINSHLAAHQSHVQQRNTDYGRIMDAVMESIPSEWRTQQSHKQDPNHDEEELFDPKYARAPRKTPSRRTALHKPLTPLGIKKSPLKALTTHFSTITTKTRKSYKASATKPKHARAVQNVRRSEDIPVDAVLFFGDLNYRVEKPRQEIESLHKQILKSSSAGGKGNPRGKAVSLDARNAGADTGGDSSALNRTSISNNYFKHTPADQRVLLESRLDRLLRFDQLNQQRRFGRVLQGFQEGSIRFPPTYKYDKGADQFDTSAKQRCPAWTDRILYYTRASSRFGAREGEESSAEVVKRIATGLSTTTPAPTDRNNEESRLVSTKNKAIEAREDNGEYRDETGEEEEEEDSKGVLRGAVDVVELVDYYSIDVRTSDHRPVCATFRLNL